MALPTILINSATGSDTAASGAGPGTAVTGTTAATDVAGTTITVDAGTNISGVATDGSAALFLNDSTTGHRNFAKITGSAGSGGATPTFTVSEAFTGSLTGKSWAVGGLRASLGSATSKRLIDNNAAAGDAMPGWIMEMQSGHAETVSATINVVRNGDSTTGRIRLRGTSGAATMPILTFSNNGHAFTPTNILLSWSFEDFEMQNSNATKTASTCFETVHNVSKCLFKGLRVNHATNKFWRFSSAFNNYSCRIKGCSFANFASNLISSGNALGLIFEDNIVDGCGADAISLLAATDIIIRRNIIVNTVGIAIILATGGVSNSTHAGAFEVEHNTLDGNSSDGMKVTGLVSINGSIRNNQFTNNGGYGLNFSNAAALAAIDGSGFTIDSNNTFGNANPYNPAALGTNDPGVNPNYVSTSGKNWTPTNPAVWRVGAPSVFGIASGATPNYPDIGAVQHQTPLKQRLSVQGQQAPVT